MPRFDHQLSQDQLGMVGEAILNWGGADNFLGYALSYHYGIKDAETRQDLITPLDTKKKAHLLKKKLIAPKYANELIEAVSELNKVMALWADDRNILAHGIGQGSSVDVYITSGKKSASKSVNDLALTVERSAYVIEMAMLIVMNIAKDDWAVPIAWPKRPPE